MNPDIVAVGGFALLFLLMLLRVPIGFAMGIVGVVGFGVIGGWAPAFNLLATTPFTVVTDYDLAIIPMFILMGAFATASGMSNELFRAGTAWFGHRRGGLALGTVAACAGFAAINGSAVATAATMTSVALPEMRRQGYQPGFATGVIAAGGTLGIMIPPSAVFALYGIMTEQDIGKLFVAGILPGILAIGLYAATIVLLGWLKPALMPPSPRTSWRGRLLALKPIWATLGLFAFVIGGMYGGLFTINEAAGMGATGAAALGILRRRLNRANIVDCLVDALRTSAAIFAIVVGAYLFGYFLTITQAAQNIAAFLLHLPVGAYGILAIILIGYLILGAIMDEVAMILLTLPIVFPVITQLGFDPIWFGVIIVMTVTLGLICPPVGMNVFVINSIARDVSLGAIYRGVTPFIAADGNVPVSVEIGG